jgi:hypothetical protein
MATFTRIILARGMTTTRGAVGSNGEDVYIVLAVGVVALSSPILNEDKSC